MGETLKFPVLGIAPARGGRSEAGEETCAYFYNARFFATADASELKRRDRDDMLLIDSKFRCWKVDKVIDLGIARRKWWEWLLDLIGRDPTHDVDYELTPLAPMTLEQVHDRIAHAIRSNPYEWQDDERIAGEDGEPVEHEVLLDEYVARVRKAKTMTKIIDTMENMF